MEKMVMVKTTWNWSVKSVLGKKIVSFRLHPFDNRRGGTNYDPVLTLDDGTTLRFETQEGEDEYGVKPIVTRPDGVRTYPGARPAIPARKPKCPPRGVA
jgi:hypothetical protein